MTPQEVLAHRLRLIKEEAKHVIQVARMYRISIEESIRHREEWHCNRKDVDVKYKDMKLFRYAEMRRLMQSIGMDLNEVPQLLRVK